MKANLCECNNCGTVYIDQNPQVNAKEYELDGSEQEMQYIDHEYWGCGICETDGYLKDL